MKTKFNILLIFIVGIGLPVLGQGTLTVEVSNIKEAKGNVNVGLFTNEDDFLKKSAVGKIVKADREIINVVFENLPIGNYAVSVIHDENANGELDSNFMGIPKEGFGFGNDAMGMFGPPSFEKALINWEGKDKSITINLKYM
jgi:uncharacterized protein (DUF2141 family)